MNWGQGAGLGGMELRVGSSIMIRFLYILLLLIWHMYFVFCVCVCVVYIVVIIICIRFVKLRKKERKKCSEFVYTKE